MRDNTKNVLTRTHGHSMTQKMKQKYVKHSSSTCRSDKKGIMSLR